MIVKSYFGKSNFESHKLHFYPEKVKVAVTAKNYIFYGIFLAVGMGIITAAFFAADWGATAAMSIFGAVFAGVGGYGAWRTKSKKLPEIDLWEKKFYPDGRSADPYQETSEYIPMADFECFELASYRVRGRKHNYTCYSLVMVFSNGRAFEILNHGSRSGVTRDAKALAEVLNVPLPECDWLQPSKWSKVAALPPMLFGIIWLVMCSFMLKQLSQEMQGGLFTWPNMVVLLFPAFGIIIIISALITLCRRK